MTPSIVTVGTFDGVHAGHREVIADLKHIAAQEGLRPVVVTFDRHPLEVIAPQRAPFKIIDNTLRDAILLSLGVELHVVPFNEDLRRLTVAEWFEHLKNLYNARSVLMGYDNTLGSDGRNMDDDHYRQRGAEAGISVLRARELPGISSSAIRHAIADADFRKAGAMLGRPFAITAEVEAGEHMARTMGAPTANLRLPPHQLLPPRGVYAAIAILPDGQSYKAALNIGVRPSVEQHGGTMSAEAHLIGFDGNLYGETISVEPRVRLRDEQKFGSIDELARQIRLDIEAAGKALSGT